MLYLILFRVTFKCLDKKKSAQLTNTHESVASPKLVLECVVVKLAVRIQTVATCVVMVVSEWIQ